MVKCVQGEKEKKKKKLIGSHLNTIPAVLLNKVYLVNPSFSVNGLISFHISYKWVTLVISREQEKEKCVFAS